VREGFGADQIFLDVDPQHGRSGGERCLRSTVRHPCAGHRAGLADALIDHHFAASTTSRSCDRRTRLRSAATWKNRTAVDLA